MNRFTATFGLGLSLLAGVLLAGCPNAHERQLLDAKDALEACDMRGANAAFEAAYDEDPSDVTSALGYSLTELALLGEDPAVTAAAMDLGFTRALDMDELFFGENAALARAARGDTCDSIQSHLEANIPHPAVGSDDAAWSYFRAGLTVTDLVNDLTPLIPTLAKISEALETAASNMDGPITLDAGCGIGTVTIQAPELFLAAAFIEATHAALVSAPGYDWGIEVATIFEGDDPKMVDALNAHFLHLRDASALTAAKPSLARAIDLARRGAVAADAVSAPVANGLFDWSQLDGTFSADAVVLAQFALDSLEGPTALPFVSPPLEVDASMFFSAPVDASTLGAPLFELSETEFGTTMNIDDNMMNQMLTPAIPSLNTDMEYNSMFGGRWDGLSFEPVFEPFSRYDDVYQCASPPPTVPVPGT